MRSGFSVRKLKRVPTLSELSLFFWACSLVPVATVLKKRPRWLNRFLGQATHPSGSNTLPATQHLTKTESSVSQAVKRASYWLPGDHNCLSQAIAGHVMLTRSGNTARIVIGMKQSEGSPNWETHAWLLGAKGIVLGGEIAGQFTPTTVYDGRNNAHAS